MFTGILNSSILARAINSGTVEINVHDFRNYTTNKHKKVDDTPYGGGAGMVMRADVVYDAYKSIKDEDAKVIYLTPQGKVLNQQKVEKLSKEEHLILLCGHYEGFDERIKTIVDMELSIGDYVLTGGEVPSMVITDAITRLIPGVISSESLDSESFDDNLLDYPNYTRPEEFRGMRVPDVLLSGHHKNIEQYRRNEQIRLTSLNRKDLSGGENDG